MRITFDFESDDIIVVSSLDDEFDDFTIGADNFWKYVVHHELNTYCEDFYDASEPDGHGQRTGTIGREEYFNSHHAIVAQDLEQYLLSKHLI